MALTCSTCGYENRADAAYCGMCKAVFRPRAAGSAVARGTPPEATAARAAASEPAAAPRSASPTFDPAAIARELAALPDPFLESFGVTLDRSLASLRLLDLFIDETWGTDGEAPGDDSYRPSRGKQHLILGFGSYLGEVVRDLVGGAWWDDPAHPGNPTATALVIGESRIFPIARVYKRLRDGASDPLHPLALYVVRQIDPRRLVACAGDYERHAQHFVSASQLPGERVDEIAAELLRTAAGLDPSRALELEARLAALVKRRAADGRSAIASPSSTPPPPAPAVAHPPDAPRGAPVEAPPPAAAEPGGLAHRGLELLIAGELDAALEPLGAWARAVEPDLDARGWITRAESLPSDTGLGELLAHYGAAASVAPGFLDAWRELGVGLAMWGSSEAALAALDRALTVAPGDATSWNHKGVTFMRMSRPLDALACWDRVLELDVRHAGAARNRGAALQRLGRPKEEVLGAFTHALELDDGHAATWYSRGDCELALGHREDAARSFQRCLDLPGANAATRAAAERYLAALAAPQR